MTFETVQTLLLVRLSSKNFANMTVKKRIGLRVFVYVAATVSVA